MDLGVETPDEEDPEQEAAVVGDDLALSVASRCFWHIDESEWAQISDSQNWRAFVGALERMGADPDADYMRALSAPPDYAGFARACHRFVGGLPTSAVPVESLYATRDQMISRDQSGEGSFWLQQPAIYMSQLIERLGMAVPDAFRDCPDHLALELDLASALLAAGAADQAADFVTSRLAWLPRYRARIASLAPEGDPTPADLTFHAALVDALIDIVRMWYDRTG